MNLSMIDTKNVILALKQVKKEKKLSLDKILTMMNENDPSSAVSKTTLSRVFAKGSEELIFKYENTLRPIANVLLDIENIEEDDSNKTVAMKSILKLKKDIIEELEGKLKTVEDDQKKKYHERLAKENDRLSITNNKLLNQFLNCPLKNKECES